MSDVRARNPVFTVNPNLRGPLRFLAEEMRKQQCSMTKMDEDAGFAKHTVGRWLRQECTPYMENVEAALNYLGYTLSVEPLRPSKGESRVLRP